MFLKMVPFEPNVYSDNFYYLFNSSLWLFVVLLALYALRVFPAETRLTVYRRPHIIPGEGARDPFVGRTFRFQTVIRAKPARNLTIYFENLNETRKYFFLADIFLQTAGPGAP